MEHELRKTKVAQKVKRMITIKWPNVMIEKSQWNRSTRKPKRLV
jgi:hypothetical protein